MDCVSFFCLLLYVSLVYFVFKARVWHVIKTMFSNYFKKRGELGVVKAPNLLCPNKRYKTAKILQI